MRQEKGRPRLYRVMLCQDIDENIDIEINPDDLRIEYVSFQWCRRSCISTRRLLQSVSRIFRQELLYSARMNVHSIRTKIKQCDVKGKTVFC